MVGEPLRLDTRIGGASGNRIIVTLIHIMKQRNLKYGLASLCIGGGMGTAVVLKNTDI